MTSIPERNVALPERPRARVAVVSSITPPDFGGGGLSAFKLASRRARVDELAFMMTRSRENGSHRVYKDLCGLPEVPNHRIVRVTPALFENRDDIFQRSLRALIDLPRLAITTFWQLVRRRHSYDVIHCFTANWLSFFAICTGKLLRKPTMLELTLLGRDDPGASMPEDHVGIKKVAKRVQFHLADALICISPAFVARCREAGISPDKVHLVPRPVDTSRFRPLNAGEQVEREEALGLSGRWPVILFVGGVCERKGADLLLPIFSHILADYPRATLLIVGAAEDKRLHQQIQNELPLRGLPDAVRFIELTGKIEHYMSVATVFLLPSRREGFANVVVEAMACQVPVVARLIPGITDFIITDGKDGFVVAGDQPEPFARVILDLLDREEIRVRIAASGRETAYGRFRLDIVDGMYRELYDRLIGGRGENAARHPFSERSILKRIRAMRARGAPLARDQSPF